MTWIAFLMLTLPPAPFTPPPAMPKAPPAKAEAKTCLCSPLCVCGCNAGGKCRCQVVQGSATHQGDARLPVVAPIIRMLVPGGVRSGNC